MWSCEIAGTEDINILKRDSVAVGSGSQREGQLVHPERFRGRQHDLGDAGGEVRSDVLDGGQEALRQVHIVRAALLHVRRYGHDPITKPNESRVKAIYVSHVI